MNHLPKTSLFLALLFLIGAALPTPGVSQEPRPPVWNRDAAVRAASSVETRPVLRKLFASAIEDEQGDLLDQLVETANRDDWPVPARERALYEFARSMGDLEPGSVNPRAVKFLQAYTAQTLVPHVEFPALGVPLYNIRAAAAGSAAAWTRERGRRQASTLARLGSEMWLDAYLAASPVERRGFLDSLDSTAEPLLRELSNGAISDRGDGSPASYLIALRGALLLRDPQLFRTAIARTDGPGLAQALASAREVFGAAEQAEVLKTSIEEAPPSTAALSIGILGPGLVRDPDSLDLLFRTLGKPELGGSAALILSASDDPRVIERLEQLAAMDKGLTSVRASWASSRQDREKNRQ